MKTIVITRPAFFDGETDLVNSLLLEGMERLHLRKQRIPYALFIAIDHRYWLTPL